MKGLHATLIQAMLDHYPNRRSATPMVEADPYEERRAELHRMVPRIRMVAIEADFKKIAKLPTEAATFHRKKLLRMHDAARLEAKLVTPAQLQRENSPFTAVDFVNARIVWKPRRARV